MYLMFLFFKLNNLGHRIIWKNVDGYSSKLPSVTYEFNKLMFRNGLEEKKAACVPPAVCKLSCGIFNMITFNIITIGST